MKTHTYTYNGTVNIDRYIPNSKFIDVYINISQVPDFYAYLRFEKVQRCEYNSTDEPTHLLHYLDCDVIRVDNSLGRMDFFTQPLQILTIKLDPRCPVKECIDMVAQTTVMLNWATIVSYEWRDTKLAYVPIVVKLHGYVAVTWSTRCQYSLHIIQHLCGVVVEVSVDTELIASFVDVGELPPGVRRNKDAIIARVSPSVEQMHFTKT